MVHGLHLQTSEHTQTPVKVLVRAALELPSPSWSQPFKIRLWDFSTSESAVDVKVAANNVPT